MMALLTGCAASVKPSPVLIEEPAIEVPARFRTCFERYGIDPPARGRRLRVDELERIALADRGTIRAMRICGRDFLAWVDAVIGKRPGAARGGGP